MRTLFIMVCMLVTAQGCAQDQTVRSITYEANSRGFFYKVMVTRESVAVYSERGQANPQTTTLTKSQWEALVKKVNEIDLNRLQSFKSPTEARSYDAAAIASLQVETKENTYNSSNFDHGNPPIELKPLIDGLEKWAIKE